MGLDHLPKECVIRRQVRLRFFIFSLPVKTVLGCLLVSAALFGVTASSSYANERVGTFAIEDLRVRATLVSEEEDGGDFSLDDSAFALSWRKNKNLSAYFALGPELSRKLPIYYAEIPKDQFGIVEGYAQYEGVYGRVRMGLIPLEFGYDGVLEPHERVFLWALPYSRGLIGNRDYGANFYTEHLGYYTQLTVHNGEIDTPSDGRMWTSGNWGYTNGRSFRMQFSMQTGSVKGEVSAGGNNQFGGVVNGETALWRNALLFAHWYKRGWNVVLQSGGGEVKQEDLNGRYNMNMAELTRYFSKNFGVGVRYDQIDPNRKVDGDMQTETSLALVVKSDDSTSNLILSFTKSIEESNEMPDDQVRLAWLLTPYSR